MALPEQDREQDDHRDPRAVHVEDHRIRARKGELERDPVEAAIAVAAADIGVHAAEPHLFQLRRCVATLSQTRQRKEQAAFVERDFELAFKLHGPRETT